MNILRIAVSIVGALIGTFVLIMLFLLVLNTFGVSHPYWGGNDNNASAATTASSTSMPKADQTGHGNEVNQAAQGNSFNPYPFYSQSCDPQQNADGGCSWDIGTMGSLDFNGGQATQVGIVKGVSISWNGKTANASPNGRCSLVVLTPNSWFENLTVRDANVTVYNVWPGDVAGWSKTLAVQAAQEQSADYKCPNKSYDQIEQWGSDIPSPPCGVQGFSNCGTTSQSSSQSGNQPTPVPAAQQPQAQQPAPVAPAPTPAPVSCNTLDCGARTATADTGGTASFNAGDAVYGYSIVIGGINHQNCYYSSAPGAGTVTDGVVHPWTAETSGKQTC